MERQDNVTHIYPLNDLDEHDLITKHTRIGLAYCECKCNPSIQRDGEMILVVHNSFDGREVFEQAHEMIQQNLN